MPRQGLLGKTTQTLTAIGLALSVTLAGRRPASAGSYPDLEVKVYQGPTMLATTRERFDFSVHLADIQKFNFVNSAVVLYVNVPPAFADVEIPRSQQSRLRACEGHPNQRFRRSVQEPCHRFGPVW